jgi:superfamily II helicase
MGVHVALQYHQCQWICGDCDAEHRDDNLAFVKQTFGGFVGADRLIAKSLDSLDRCVALRRLLAPRYEAWLARSGTSQ